MKKSISILTLLCLFTLSVFMTAHCEPVKADTVEGVKISIEPTNLITAKTVYEAQIAQWQTANVAMFTRADGTVATHGHVGPSEDKDGGDGKTGPRNAGEPLCCGCIDYITHSSWCWYPTWFLFDCYYHPFKPCKWS